jgi:predicted RNA binding protein YcfA (HicA-like mRNA interferase family)
VPPRRVTYRELVGKLLAAGFAIVGQRGSHVKFGKQQGPAYLTVTVPRHREIAIGTLRSILRQSGLSWEDFDAL